MGLALCLLILTACAIEAGSHGLPKRLGDTGGPTPIGHIAFQPPLLPITFSIDTDGKIKVALAARLVGPLGAVTVSGGVVRDLAGGPLPPEPADVTQLIICQQDSAGQRCEAYEIVTGRKIRIEMNGGFVQEVERNRIIIAAALGSTIKVTDNGPPTRLDVPGPARIDVEEFNFNETSEEAEVDLERSRSGTDTDLSYDHITAELKTIHGAKVSIYDTYSWSEPDARKDYPGEEECLKTPAENWKDAFSKDDLENKYITTWNCSPTVSDQASLALRTARPPRTRSPSR